MEIIQQKRTIEVLYDLFALRPGKTQFVKSNAYKVPFPSGKKTLVKPLPRSTPEQEGVRSADVAEFFRCLTAADANLHTVMLLRHGKVIAEMSYKPYSSKVWHVTHSMCKTLTALAVMMLMDEGKLSEDSLVMDLLSDVKALPFSKHRNLTVRHLLTMSSGVSFAEAGSVTDEDWLKEYFEATVKFEPGTEFAYNSMNSYVLSAIVTAVTGKPMTDYLDVKLFRPLEISTYHWEKCPHGIVKGGWGLYLMPEDMAKIGELIRNNGKWNGKQLVSSARIKKLGTKTMDTPEAMGKYGYGMQAWCGARKGWTVCNGLFGQNVIVCPDIGVTLVTTGGVDALFQNCPMTDIVEEFLLDKTHFSDCALPKDARGQRELSDVCTENGEYPAPKDDAVPILGRFLSFKRGKMSSVPEFCQMLDGVSYKMDAENVSVMPIVPQVMQNIYEVGVDGIGFEYDRKNDRFFVVFDTKKRTERVPVGFGRSEFFDHKLGGEVYKLASSGEMSENEDGIPVLKLRIACLEISSERRIKIFFEKNGSITVKWSELPGRKLIIDSFEYMVKPSLNKPIIGAIASKTDGDYLIYRLDRVIEPTTHGKIDS